MLNGRLLVHGIDAEKHAAMVMHSTLRRMQADLRSHQLESLLAFLIAELWRLGETYDPERDRNPNFRSYSAAILPNRVVQWFRDEWVDERYDYGDAAQRDAIAFPHSLDAPVGHSDDGDPQRLGDIVPIREGGDQAVGDSLMERLIGERDRERARDLAILRQGLVERTTTRARRNAA